MNLPKVVEQEVEGLSSWPSPKKAEWNGGSSLKKAPVFIEGAPAKDAPSFRMASTDASSPPPSPERAPNLHAAPDWSLPSAEEASDDMETVTLPEMDSSEDKADWRNFLTGNEAERDPEVTPVEEPSMSEDHIETPGTPSLEEGFCTEPSEEEQAWLENNLPYEVCEEPVPQSPYDTVSEEPHLLRDVTRREFVGAVPGIPPEFLEADFEELVKDFELKSPTKATDRHRTQHPGLDGKPQPRRSAFSMEEGLRKAKEGFEVHKEAGMHEFDFGFPGEEMMGPPPMRRRSIPEDLREFRAAKEFLTPHEAMEAMAHRHGIREQMGGIGQVPVHPKVHKIPAGAFKEGEAHHKKRMSKNPGFHGMPVRRSSHCGGMMPAPGPPLDGPPLTPRRSGGGGGVGRHARHMASVGGMEHMDGYNAMDGHAYFMPGNIRAPRGHGHGFF